MGGNSPVRMDLRTEMFKSRSQRAAPPPQKRSILGCTASTEQSLKPPTPDSFLMDSDTPQSKQAFTLVTDYEWATY